MSALGLLIKQLPHRKLHHLEELYRITLLPNRGGGKIVVAVADNLDHNERTVDEKRTTHAMTSILVSSTSVENRISQRLGKSSRRTFDKKCLPGGSLCCLTAYKKPSQRPTPVFESSVTLDEINPVEPNAVKSARLKKLLYTFGRTSVFCDDLAEDKKSVHATEEVQQSMTTCLERGYQMFGTFVSERLIAKGDGSDPPEKNVFAPMQRSYVKTMSDMKQKKQRNKRQKSLMGQQCFKDYWQ
ncbi:hypothetical protein MAR_029955 [Mya arenaria]|uniref:Uncharacterized protein n=1 Tax=Mya arenaria TaxID=6604 RepID=A0ABY7DQN2_MYAAR|nr:hypothetical protein MAR_029955 [Mya arenaria]